MKKIIDSYKRLKRLPNYHTPEFQLNTSEFHVVLWNLNYGSDSVIDEKEFRKEFLKAQRMIYKMISVNPRITIAEMAVNIRISDRQVHKYIKRRLI